MSTQFSAQLIAGVTVSNVLTESDDGDRVGILNLDDLSSKIEDHGLTFVSPGHSGEIEDAIIGVLIKEIEYDQKPDNILGLIQPAVEESALKLKSIGLSVDVEVYLIQDCF